MGKTKSQSGSKARQNKGSGWDDKSGKNNTPQNKSKGNKKKGGKK